MKRGPQPTKPISLDEIKAEQDARAAEKATFARTGSVVTIRGEPEMWRKVRVLGSHVGLSMNAMLVRLVQDFVEREWKERDETNGKD